MLGEENLSLVTNYPHRDTTPARTRMERHCAGPPQISSPGSRARTHTIVSSKGAHANIYDDIGATGNTISSQVVV